MTSNERDSIEFRAPFQKRGDVHPDYTCALLIFCNMNPLNFYYTILSFRLIALGQSNTLFSQSDTLFFGLILYFL